jgi:hypothetical protein
VKRFWRSWTSFACVAVIACGPAHQAAAQDATDLPPAGYGSLRQDEIGIRLNNPTLSVRVVPLDEHVTRLLAPDAYRSLREMRQSRATEISQAARAAGYDSVSAFMVTFFGMQPSVRFNPDELYISSQNITYRPVAIVPITPRWSENTIEQRQQAAAIYLFEPISILRPFTLYYGPQASEAWSDALRQLNTERGRVLARAQQAQQQQQPPAPAQPPQ